MVILCGLKRLDICYSCQLQNIVEESGMGHKPEKCWWPLVLELMKTLGSQFHGIHITVVIFCWLHLFMTISGASGRLLGFVNLTKGAAEDSLLNNTELPSLI